MKKIYWRPRGVSRTVLVLLSIIALGGYLAVESFKKRTKQPYHAEKTAAARLALDWMDVIKSALQERNDEIDAENDPTQSGLIGELITPVTSDPGLLAAKQTTINPNFAAVVVEMLKQAGAKKGDTIAVGVSGSFPALNICAYAAAQVLELKPIIIASAAASQWGANRPDFLWIDMERVLYDEKQLGFRSVAASLGGIEDRAVGIPDEGRDLLAEAIKRNGLEFIKPKNVKESIDRRMALYREKSGGAPIRAYINVGGGTVSVGSQLGKKSFTPGLNKVPPPGIAAIDSVMKRFILDKDNRVPVIHLSDVQKIAKDHGLPMQPKTMPPIGEGKIFYQDQYNQWLTSGVLAGILLCLYAFVYSDWGSRILQSAGHRKDKLGHPEPMV